MIDIKVMKKAREDLVMTQGKVAQEVGVSGNTVRHWEWGMMKPNAKNEAKLRKVLKIKD